MVRYNYVFVVDACVGWEFVWKCRQDVADVVVVGEEEEEVAEDPPPHVIPGVIFVSYTISKIL